MVSDKRKEFDFLFVVTVIPTDNSGGSRILYSLARSLSDHGYIVGWVLLSNPYRFIYNVTRDRSLLPDRRLAGVALRRRRIPAGRAGSNGLRASRHDLTRHRGRRCGHRRRRL